MAARFEVFGNACWMCGTTERVGIDHVIAKSRGGLNWPANVRPACRSCNSSKGAYRRPLARRRWHRVAPRLPGAAPSTPIALTALLDRRAQRLLLVGECLHCHETGIMRWGKERYRCRCCWPSRSARRLNRCWNCNEFMKLERLAIWRERADIRARLTAYNKYMARWQRRHA